MAYCYSSATYICGKGSKMDMLKAYSANETRAFNVYLGECGLQWYT
jgi:hypothetical protein